MLAEANMRVKDISTSSDMISLDEHNVSITTKQPTASRNSYSSKPVPNVQGSPSHCNITSYAEICKTAKRGYWGHVYIFKRGIICLHTHVCVGEYIASHLDICILHIIHRSSKPTYQRQWHSHKDCRYLGLVYSEKELLTGNTLLYFPNSYIITKRLHPKALNSYN